MARNADTADEMRSAGYAKINQYGGSFVEASFYNPTTKDLVTRRVRDYEYSDCSRDNDSLYYMPIDEAVVKQYKIDNGIIFKGATIVVVKGRKVPKGTVAVVEKITPWYDQYGRWQCDYAHLDNGMRTNVKNCQLL